MHSRQLDVLNSKARYKVLVAGRRFGKTVLAIINLILYGLEHTGSLTWYVSPSYKQSKMIAWRLLKSLCPREIITKTNESELYVELINGSIIELKGADNYDSLRGAGVWFMVIDEFASILDAWSVWNEVLRPTLTDKQGGVLFIGTPKGKDSFYELFLRGQKADPTWQSWQFKTADNPYIEKKEIEEARRTMPDRYFKQEYEASFEDFQGLIYPEFDESVHVCKPFFIQKVFKRIGSIDPAISGTTAALKAAIDEEGRFILYEEYYDQNKRVSEVCDALRKEDEDIKWFIDPASKIKNIQKGEDLHSLYDEYAEYGIRALPAINDVTAGINRVGEYFKQNKIVIFSTLTNLIWEVERYHWTEERETINGIIEPKPYKKHDHLMDNLKYIISSMTAASDISYTKPVHTSSPKAFMERAKKLNGSW